VKVVFVVADSLRADAPAYAGGPSVTPTLDRLASEGAQFPDAVASAAWTVPSVTAMLTGTFPHKVGIARWRHPFPRRRPSLFTAFSAAGFRVRSQLHNPRFAFASSGFRGEVGDSEIPDDVDQALRESGGDRFVFIHHWWTHLPYRQELIPRKPWRRLCNEDIRWLADDPEEAVPNVRDRYHAALESFDALLGRYLEAALAGGEEVLLCVTGDHGETWGDSLPPGHRMEHIYDLHGRWLTDETTRVPLVFWSSSDRVRAGAVPGFARGVDVAPTLCGLAGVPWPGPLPTHDGPTLIDRGIEDAAPLDGLSLARCIADARPVPIEEALTVTSHNAILPAKYPKSARRLWCRYGLRRAHERFVWDGQFGLRDVHAVGQPAGEAMGPWGRLKERLSPRAAVWARLAAEREVALAPGDPLPKDLFARFGPRGDEPEGFEGGALADQMAMLGYGD